MEGGDHSNHEADNTHANRTYVGSEDSYLVVSAMATLSKTIVDAAKRKKDALCEEGNNCKLEHRAYHYKLEQAKKKLKQENDHKMAWESRLRIAEEVQFRAFQIRDKALATESVDVKVEPGRHQGATNVTEVSLWQNVV